MPSPSEPSGTENAAPQMLTYFTLQPHQGLMYGHIALMLVAWVLVLPAALMFRLARHRDKLPLSFAFLLLHSLGVILGTVYNARTPDLYPNNAHHKLGWALTCIALAHFAASHASLASRFINPFTTRKASEGEQESFLPLTSDGVERHIVIHGQARERYHLAFGNVAEYWASGHDASSTRSPSPTALGENQPIYYTSDDDADQVSLEDRDTLPAAGYDPLSRGRWKLIHRTMLRPTRKALHLLTAAADRTLPILGFVAICTGMATFGRFFEGENMLNGIAHWIKGAVFVWLGIFTLGRWSGAFGEIGWAWNIRPANRDNKWRPSAEFVESGLIFFYGTTNIFLEHLSNWGGTWEARDLEHVSITVLFIGGGLCGMLVESSSIRGLLNTNVPQSVEADEDEMSSHVDKIAVTSQPDQPSVSMNPLPALVIMLLGIIMSSHKQDSDLSTMIHRQWGNLLTASSFARALTYVMIYLKPPLSTFPSRPPTELLTSFGLISGGVMLIASSTDTVNGMMNFGLDAMFVYTLTLGFVGLLMAWVLTLLALKGWAVREAKRC